MLLLFNNVMENYMPTKLNILFNSVKTQLQQCYYVRKQSGGNRSAFVRSGTIAITQAKEVAHAHPQESE